MFLQHSYILYHLLSLSLSLSLSRTEYSENFSGGLILINRLMDLDAPTRIIPITDLANHVPGGYTDKCSLCPARSFLTPDSLIHQVCLSSIKLVHIKRYESAVLHRFTV